MTQKIKLIIGMVITAIIIALSTTIVIMNNRINVLNYEISNAITNIKAYELENSALRDDTIEFKYTIEQLNYSKDSLNQRINKLRKDLKIKDKDIQKLQYMLSENQKKDSIVFVHDTLFRENIKVDTILNDNWSKLHLQLEYPNTVLAEYSFKNESLVTTYIKKETVNPPHKCAFIRWFQKKHKVIHVEINEQNPYCEIKEQRFINIID